VIFFYECSLTIETAATLSSLYLAIKVGVDVEALVETWAGVDLEEYLPRQAGVLLIAYTLNHVSTSNEAS